MGKPGMQLVNYNQINDSFMALAEKNDGNLYMLRAK